MIATSLCIYRVFVLRARSVREAHNTAFWRRKTASSADWFLFSKRVLFLCTRHALPSLCHPTQDSSGSWLHPALLLPTIRFSPSRHHDSPKMHLTSRFSAWYWSVTSSLLHWLKTQTPYHRQQDWPLYPSLPLLPSSPLSAGSSPINSSVPWVSLSPHLRALESDLSAWNLLSLTWSLRVPSWHLGFSSNVTSSQRLSNVLESHKQQIKLV